MEELALLQRELARERAARKQAEQLLEQKSLELYHRNRELEAEVAERSRIEISLRDHSAELLRTNDELEQFAYIASHDLQAPLRGIIGFSQLLQRRAADKLDAACLEYLQFINDGALRLRAVIEDLLNFSRAGREVLEPQNLQLGELLAKVLKELHPVLAASAAEVRYGELPAVQGGETLLVQLLRNLVDNAIKYVAVDTRPVVSIEAADSQADVVVRVIDNGIGIAAEHSARIFQIFQRLHTQDQYPGTGIGLAICKKIVDRHGGRIWLERPAAGGCTFAFSLPKLAVE